MTARDIICGRDLPVISMHSRESIRYTLHATHNFFTKLYALRELWFLR